ncbi:hypothetical protein PMAYCL1PPCAC_04948 [Pristionchus mayeri]|uniref:Tetratricopeptide repeat protein 38 n=1 Tax=Pristionchus mayeri TaxID=1317129 RepID=A0AAN4ZA35_9BILA|nr:hypothetical protein PMAYCL1PPCAC_04948 [Pristionchus mayeri]
MAAWCADNLRDLAGWEASNLSLSCSSNEAARLLDGSIRQIVSWRDCDLLDGISKTFERLKEAEPDAALASALLLNMEAFGTGTSVEINPEFRKLVERNEALARSPSINARERLHLMAASLWARGYLPEAQDTWEEILAEYPNDLIAVKFAHDSYFFSGNAQGKRDSVARVLPHWRKDEPCRSYLHGMLAFGLEECGQYEEAERNALVALSLRREDCWATHARAHVMEMQGRSSESREFLEGTVQDWEPGWMLACHNHWHNALNYIEEGQYEVPLQLFDNEIGRRARRSEGCLDIVDAASILWRLELEGVDVGKRWSDLPDLSRHIHDHFLSFNDAHYVFALQRAGKDKDAHELVRSLQGFVRSGPSNNSRRVAEEVGQSLCEGMLAYCEGDYAKAVSCIMPVRAGIHRIAGSHAQNDVFTQTLVHACLKTGETEHKEFARTVLLERAQKKAHTGIAERLAKKLAESQL